MTMVPEETETTPAGGGNDAAAALPSDGMSLRFNRNKGMINSNEDPAKKLKSSFVQDNSNRAQEIILQLFP